MARCAQIVMSEMENDRKTNAAEEYQAMNCGRISVIPRSTKKRTRPRRPKAPSEKRICCQG